MKLTRAERMRIEELAHRLRIWLAVAAIAIILANALYVYLVPEPVFVNNEGDVYLMDEQNMELEEIKKAERKAKIKKEIREWVVSLAVAVLVALIIRTFLFTIIRVDGDSMNTTLLNNERMFATIIDVKLGGVQRNDVVICHYPNRGRTYFVKRVVGLPGDQVRRENGVTYVNDTPLDERVALLYPNGSSTDYAPYTLKEDEYFVAGDNRMNSHDSRDWNDNNPTNDVGPITKKMIVGKARYVIWPLNKIRSIE